MKELKLKPCKIHKTMPKFREREPVYDPYFNNAYYRPSKVKEYYCAECELDRDMMEKNRIIQDWNERQDKK